MAEALALTNPETKPSITTWAVRSCFIDPTAPSVKTEFLANTGETRIWRYVVSETVTLAQVKAGISFINQGKFMTVQGKSLEKWLIQQAQTAGVLGAGTVSGTVD